MTTSGIVRANISNTTLETGEEHTIQSRIGYESVA